MGRRPRGTMERKSRKVAKIKPKISDRGRGRREGRAYRPQCIREWDILRRR